MISAGAPNSTRLRQAVEQLQTARKYTIGLLADLTDDEWFAMPGGVTHIAWQVGHLATAEYRLCLERIRGELSDDGRLISLAMLTLFGRGSAPVPEPEKYPPIKEIRASFDRVHQAAIAECAKIPDDELDNAVLKPHKFVITKLQAIQWCARHEMLHAGQIALLRRMSGKPWSW